MEKFQSWFYTNSCVVNTEKTIAVSYHTRENRNPLKPQVKFDNMCIVCKSEFKFLGLYIRKCEMEYTSEVTKLKIEQVCFVLIFKVVSDPACCMEHVLLIFMPV